MNLDLLEPHTITFRDSHLSLFLQVSTLLPQYKELDYLQAICDAVNVNLLNVLYLQNGDILLIVAENFHSCVVNGCECCTTVPAFLCTSCGSWICVFCHGTHFCDGEYLDAGGSL